MEATQTGQRPLMTSNNILQAQDAREGNPTALGGEAEGEVAVVAAAEEEMVEVVTGAMW